MSTHLLGLILTVDLAVTVPRGRTTPWSTAIMPVSTFSSTRSARRRSVGEDIRDEAELSRARRCEHLRLVPERRQRGAPPEDFLRSPSSGRRPAPRARTVGGKSELGRSGRHAPARDKTGPPVHGVLEQLGHLF